MGVDCQFHDRSSTQDREAGEHVKSHGYATQKGSRLELMEKVEKEPLMHSDPAERDASQVEEAVAVARTEAGEPPSTRAGRTAALGPDA